MRYLGFFLASITGPFMLVTILLTIFLLFLPQPVLATETAGSSGVLKLAEAPKDQRIEKLQGFLESQGSLLAPFAQDFVQKADEYEINWKLLAAISGIESTFGKNIIRGTYNAYGWGGGLIRFQSWPDSIDQVSKALREKYYDQGLDTPYKINPVYCPPNRTWAAKVAFTMEKIENSDFQKSLRDVELTI